jgi:hypothetical protein
VFVTNPLLGEITNSADPERNLFISPIASPDMLNNPPPSPSKSEDEIEP